MHLVRQRRGSLRLYKCATRWNPDSFVRTLYAVAKVLQLEPAGTRRNPRRNPDSFVRTPCAVAKGLQTGTRWNPAEPAAEPGFFQGRSSQFHTFRLYPVIYLYY